MNYLENNRNIQMKFFLGTVLTLAASSHALRCDMGSLPDANSMCIRPKYIEGCFNYSSETKCLQCNYNYELQDNGLCSFNEASAQPCCLEAGTSGCAKCNRGLSLIDGICQQVPIVGCLQKDDNGKCVNCAQDFILEKGSCKSGIKNCQIYTDQTMKVCQKCLPNFSLITNTCLRNKILGCKHEENYSCTSCFAPFKNEEGRCTINKCKDYNDFGCQSCDCGFYLTRTGECKKIDEGCIRYQKGICTDCYPPFTLQGIGCVIDGCQELENGKCSRCAPEYNLEDGHCKLPHCLKGSNGKCEMCEERFKYVHGRCEESSPKLIFNPN